MIEGLLITGALGAVVAALFLGARAVMRARDILDAEQRLVVEVPAPEDFLPRRQIQ